MDPDKVLAMLSGDDRITRQLRYSLEHQLTTINRNYMAALARLYKVDYRTVLIWHATGLV
ncbi:hypothetical protein IXEL_43 [Microbacterium phage Ixel]|nr:hypothetical protein IXEL_43 [Microbacterium phage Ixel]